MRIFTSCLNISSRCLIVSAGEDKAMLARIWRIIILPYQVVRTLFAMVAHPEHYSFDDDDE
jgi:hypothetical protein